MRVLSRSVYLVTVLTVVACTDRPTPVAPFAAKPMLNAGNGVVVQAMGAGVVNFDPAGDFGDGKFQFVAIKQADGTVSGHFYQSRMRAAGLVEFYGVVTCVTIDPAYPGRARIGGIVTVNNSTDPAFLTTNHEVGDDVWFRVEDSGNGNGTGQKSTTYGFKPTLVNTSAEYCALPFEGFLNGQNFLIPASIFPLEIVTIRVNY